MILISSLTIYLMPLLHMGIEKGSRPVELFISNNALLKENVKPSVVSFNYLKYHNPCLARSAGIAYMILNRKCEPPYGPHVC